MNAQSIRTVEQEAPTFTRSESGGSTSPDLVDNLIIDGRPFIEIADTVLAGYFKT